jgi:hypothetical protein
LYSSAGNGTSQPIFDVRIVLICRKRDLWTLFGIRVAFIIWIMSCVHHLRPIVIVCWRTAIKISNLFLSCSSLSRLRNVEDTKQVKEVVNQRQHAVQWPHDVKTTTSKTEDWATQISLKPGVNSCATRRVSRSCSTNL